MALNPYVCLQHNQVALSGRSGPFCACPHCGGTNGLVNIIGGNPHNGQVVCKACGMHVSWIGRAHLDAMLASRSAA